MTVGSGPTTLVGRTVGRLIRHIATIVAVRQPLVTCEEVTRLKSVKINACRTTKPGLTFWRICGCIDYIHKASRSYACAHVAIERSD